MKTIQGLTAAILITTGLIPSAKALTLEEYLGQVRGNNDAVKGIRISTKAKSQRQKEGTLIFRPSFFLTGEYSDDQRPTNAPAFQGLQTLRRTFQAGFNENFRTGTKASLSYNMYKTDINGAQAGFLTRDSFFDLAPQITVSQSLWRNFLGKEFEGTEQAQNAQIEAGKWSDQYNLKNLLIQAENAYWNLFYTESRLNVQKQSIERSRKIRDWNLKRFKSNLVDESDYLQAEANLQSAEIEYQTIYANLEQAQREFNSIRQVEGPISLLGNDSPNTDFILRANRPEKVEMREDVLAAMAQKKLASANAALGEERNKPTLEVYGSYSINGRDRYYSQAWTQAAEAYKPYSIIGVRFNTPIDIGAMDTYKKSYADEKIAAELAYRRKAFEVEKEWEILSEKFENYKKRLELSIRKVRLEEKKYAAERQRYTQGRTTTFQVIQFEQDLANAQLLKLINEQQLVTTYNQLKLFSGVVYE